MSTTSRTGSLIASLAVVAASGLFAQPEKEVTVIAYGDTRFTDPNNVNFCAPENANIDFPPIGEWTRIGVHYYSSHSLQYDVHAGTAMRSSQAISEITAAPPTTT